MDKVKSGQPLNIRANDWNAVADVVNGQMGRTGGTGAISGNVSQVTTIDVLNDSETTMRPYEICEISSHAMSKPPMDDKKVYHHPIFVAIPPVAANYGKAVYAISQQTIKPRHVGRVCVAGVTAVDTSHSGYSPSANDNVADYYVQPSFGGFTPMLTTGLTAIRMVAYQTVSPTIKLSMCYIEPFVSVSRDTGGILARVQSSANETGVCRVRLYANGYDQSSTGEAYMFLPEITYGRNLPHGANVLVFPHMTTTIEGEMDTGEET